jgi:uncharacterized membrane protein YqaE (UPF0057 family)
VAEVPIERVGVKAKWLLIARCGDEATRCRGGATHGNGLGTCHSKGASMVVGCAMFSDFFVEVCLLIQIFLPWKTIFLESGMSGKRFFWNRGCLSVVYTFS